MSALVFLAPGFEEIEAITVIDILRRAEIETVVAGLVTNPIPAARHTRHLADVHLAESPLVRDWLARQRERDQWVAAICAAPTALLTHGWLQPEQKIISHPSVQARFPVGQVQGSSRVVVDGKLITSLAAGSAMEFAFEIVRQLRGSDAVGKVNQGVHAVV